MSEYLDWHKLTPGQIYYLILKPVEDSYISVGRQMGLDAIVDLNVIRPKRYRIVDLGEFNGFYDPLNNIILLNIKLLSKDRMYLYHTLFHEYTHKVRCSIFHNNRDRDRVVEETIAETLSFVFLSKVFKKEKIEDFAKIIMTKAWGNYPSKYLDNLLYYLHNMDKRRLPYYLGTVLGYLLLNVDEEKQKEYVRRLLEIGTLDSLRTLLYDLGKYVPKKEEIITYYNLIKRVIEVIQHIKL